jgi:acetyl esterase/lipase
MLMRRRREVPSQMPEPDALRGPSRASIAQRIGHVPRTSLCTPIGRIVRSMMLIGAIAAGTGDATAGAKRQQVAPDGIPSPDPDHLIDIGRWNPAGGRQQIPLWPAGLAMAKPETDKPETTVKGTRLVGGRSWSAVMNVSTPTMTVYPPRGRNGGAAMLVLPGGGYEVVAIDLEGTEICDWVTAQGMTCILLKYRVPQSWHAGPNGAERAPPVQLALQDAQRAMSLIRYRAATLKIDPRRVGVIGFSAGGHLVQAVSNADRRSYKPVDAADSQPSRPDLAIALYPGHIRDSSGGKASDNTRLAPWITVSPKAPPTFILHSVNDPTDSVYQSFAYGLALKKAGVPFEMHLYAYGGHAFGLRPSKVAMTAEWPGLVVQWLHSLGIG